MAQAQVSLDDKYTRATGRIYLSGTQALVRLLLMQKQCDAEQGLNTAGFVSGYRGSPLGALDQQLWRAQRFLKRANIIFKPGVNEELAGTAVWGTQQLKLFGGAKVDGVFGMWYGKGPGVDRSGDVLRHANLAGASQQGGVLALAGDDHGAKSSTVAGQSDFVSADIMMPMLYPATVQEVIDFGLYGWRLSRFSGCWVSLKMLPETTDASASVSVDPHRTELVEPGDIVLPPGGFNARWPDTPLEQEQRLHRYRIPAVHAFSRVNPTDRTVIDCPRPRFGIVTSGKAYLDVMQALSDLGIDDATAADAGLKVYKVGMVWPLEPVGLREFARGLDEILVVEEKRAVIESQIKEQLYALPDPQRPRVVGKHDENGDWLVPSNGELTPAGVARTIAARLRPFFTHPRMTQRLEFLDRQEQSLSAHSPALARTPYFCSGCPHNTSTVVPAGSRALAGIGCHYMAQWMDRDTATFTQMGGEGGSWIGQAPFSETEHVFVNIGDGTYIHSGSLAIRAAVIAGVNVTYKVLYNDAVAMTGGQPVDDVSVAQITHQMYGEGVKEIVIVTDDVAKYSDRSNLAPGVSVHDRRELDRIQRRLREIQGATVLIYDQTCAAEKRRRRKRGLLIDPPKRVFINEAVCEGCGDCGVYSNCLSVVPTETEFGRKRKIDQSACNKDYRCLEGLCPSFVTIHGGSRRQRGSVSADLPFDNLPEPKQVNGRPVYGILVTGVGGTGVVTIGALLGMAAHIEGKHCLVLDQTGLAQKYGAVMSHVQIADDAHAIHAARIATGNADLVLGADLVTAASDEGLQKLHPDNTHVVLNSHQSVVADFTRNADLDFKTASMTRSIAQVIGDDKCFMVDATSLATRLLGDSIATNLFLVGYAYQKGLIPLSGEAIAQAIEVNDVAVTFNQQAFLWGRRAAHDVAAVNRIVGPEVGDQAIAQTLEGMVARRGEYLTAYQDKAYAQRYRDMVDRFRETEAQKTPGRKGVTEAVARYYFKVLAYKDEYEVARLYTETDFLRQLETEFEGDYKIRFHLAPPLLSKPDPHTGRLTKKTYGGWMLGVFRLLAKLKGLRGTGFDIFGYLPDRRRERQLIVEYERLLHEVLAVLDQDNHEVAVELLSLPEYVRGFGIVKETSVKRFYEQAEHLTNCLRETENVRVAS